MYDISQPTYIEMNKSRWKILTTSIKYINLSPGSSFFKFAVDLFNPWPCFRVTIFDLDKGATRLFLYFNSWMYFYLNISDIQLSWLYFVQPADMSPNNCAISWSPPFITSMFSSTYTKIPIKKSETHVPMVLWTTTR